VPKASFPERMFARLITTPCPRTHDVLGRPIIGPCLIWIGPAVKGYGYIGIKRKTCKVYRVMYELFVGPIKDELDHLCCVTLCASPAHLEDVTTQENLRRADPGAWQRAKMHCPRGHPYNDANTQPINGGKGRNCRACDREDWRTKKGIPLDRPNRRDGVRCINGHVRTVDNTLVSIEKGRTRRRCRDCQREGRPNPRACHRRQAAGTAGPGCPGGNDPAEHLPGLPVPERPVAVAADLMRLRPELDVECVRRRRCRCRRAGPRRRGQIPADRRPQPPGRMVLRPGRRRPAAASFQQLGDG
jgi:hypothetical protein